MTRTSLIKKRQIVAKSVKGRVTHAELVDREEKVARLKTFLKATSPEFTARVAKAQQHLGTVESGVLAGPVKLPIAPSRVSVESLCYANIGLSLKSNPPMHFNIYRLTQKRTHRLFSISSKSATRRPK